MRVLSYFVVLCVFCLSAGCKVSPPGSATSTGELKLEISLSSTNQVDDDSFPNSDEMSVKVRLVDANNTPQSGQIIAVSSSLGALTITQVLTNADGYATTKILPSNSLGAGILTASFDKITAKQNFELLGALPPTPTSKPKILLSLLRAGLAINRFKSDEIVQLQALVTDENNTPLANRVVKFSAELGTTNVPTGLTNLSGIAQVNLSSDNTKLGAAEATASVSIDSVNLISSVNYEIIDSAITITEQVTKLGYFNSSNMFVENSLGSSIVPDVNGEINISAGGTLGISLALVDENNQRIMTPTQVNFSSVCADSKKARIGTSIFTVNGVANTTYEDISCGGNQDAIQATVTLNNQTKNVSQTIRIAPENIGSIEFISSSPESIVLKGTGGQGLQETSTLTFLVKGTLGNPLAQQTVTFNLNTSAGNLTIIPASSITNSLGLVTTKVNAGNVPTAVRVTASVTTASNQVIQTQSDLLSVNTGMPDQDSFSLATELANPEADTYDAIDVVISARLADAFNNPVPDGTSINFTTEGGSIVPTCNTINGACSVKWTSAEPRVANHRITILATAVGHETFFDTNGSNTFDAADGAAFTNTYDSGFGRIPPAANGFWDMSEAWRDDNENFAFDLGEKFIDFDNDQISDVPDGLFNGPQCQGVLCGSGNKTSLHVRRALVMIMSGSNALLTLASGTQFDSSNSTYPYLGGAKIYESNVSGLVKSPSLTLAEDTFEEFTLYFSDDGLPFGQILPAGTQVTIAASEGKLAGNTSFTVPNSIGGSDPDAFNGNAISFILTNTNSTTNVGDKILNGILSIIVTTPNGTPTAISLSYVLTGS
jgi:Bacterial Ig-like domain (group 1)